MVSTLNDIVTLTSDSTFINRVKAAIVYQAVQIIQQTDSMVNATPLDQKRRNLAVQVIGNRDVYAAHFAWILSTVSSINASTDDGTLVSTVASAWNYLANI